MSDMKKRFKKSLLMLLISALLLTDLSVPVQAENVAEVLEENVTGVPGEEAGSEEGADAKREDREAANTKSVSSEGADGTEEEPESVSSESADAAEEPASIFSESADAAEEPASISSVSTDGAERQDCVSDNAPKEYEDAAENPQLDPQWWREQEKLAAGEEELILENNFGAGITHDERFSYYTIQNGIDVSKYQGNIDWKKVKADGVEFAFVRVGFRGYGAAGNMAEDAYYRQNIVNAAAQGIKVGVYIFSQAITRTEAQQEAEYVLARIKDLPVTLPVVMDYEYASSAQGATGRLYNAGLTKDQATDICKAFVQKVKAEGYTPMVYANKNMLENSLNGEELADSCKIWLAQYSKKATYAGTYAYWQYTSSGKVDGISGRVDMNFYYKKPVSFRIHYDLAGGKQNSGNPRTFYYQVKDVVLKAPKRTGYTFTGWVWNDPSKPEYGSPATVVSAATKGAVYVRATWKENWYTVYFHAGNADYAANPEQEIVQSYPYSQMINLYRIAEQISIKPEFVSGNSIVAFTTKPKGGKKYKVEKLCSKLAKTEGARVDLYAVYGMKNYGITYLLTEEDVKNYEASISQNETVSDDKISGNGVVSEDNISGNGVVSEGNISGKTAASDAGIVLSSAQTYSTASYENIINSNPVSYAYSTKKTVRLKKPKRPGYIFNGWELVSGNAAGVDLTKNKILKGAEGDLVLKAVWTPVPYKVQLSLNTRNKNIFWKYQNAKTVLLESCYNSCEPYHVAEQIQHPSDRMLVEFNTKANGKGISVPVSESGEILLNGLSTRKNAKVKLYAIWE